MQKKSLTGALRNDLKKNASGRLRRAGKIPAVIYGHQEPVSIAIDALEFNKKFKIISENIIISLDIDGNNYDVLVKDYQENLIRGQIEHIDFYEIERGKTLKTHIPIHIQGVAMGTRLGGIFEWLSHEVEIECLPKNIPDTIQVEVSDLDIGNSIHVSDLNLGDDVKLLSPETQVICQVVKKREEVEETDEDDEDIAEEETAE